jgi:cytochrome c oxidase subunit III
MDLTQGTNSYKQARAKKMMLWFGIISMAMMFAGLTSAYVVSSKRPDWLGDLQLPTAFIWSTLVILLSSVTIHLALKAAKKGNHSRAMAGFIATLGLSFAFIALQFMSFSELLATGYFFTGSASSVTTSFLYLIIGSHLAHLIGGIVVLLVIIYNHFKQKYSPGQTLGIELGATYWHFVDALWIYLFFFLYFVT